MDMLTYREILSVIAKMEEEYLNVKKDENSSHHQKKHAHQAIFVLARVDKKMREAIQSKFKKGEKNGENKKNFWSFW